MGGDKEPAIFGIIAGKGDLPLVLVKNIRSTQGSKCVAIVFEKQSLDLLKNDVENIKQIAVGQIGKAIKFMKTESVTEILFVGKVEKRAIFENPKFDLTALRILKNLSLKNDDALMSAIAGEFESNGFTVHDQAEFLSSMMPPANVFTKKQPDKSALVDIDLGMNMAREMGRLDIGQSVLVKDGAIIAVEAIEGTDEAIDRAASLSNGGFTLCKCAKPLQDGRFDRPTIGMTTVEKVIDGGGVVIAIEADRTLVVDLEKIIKTCDKAGIVFTAVKVNGK